MFSQTAEYALRAAVKLAANPGRSFTSAEIATEMQVPAGYMAKVLQTLARNGIVKSVRGIGGGFSLAQMPDTLSILNVINAVDPLKRIERCPLGLPEHQPLCPLHRELDAAVCHIETQLRGKTLADIVDSTQPNAFPAAE